MKPDTKGIASDRLLNDVRTVETESHPVEHLHEISTVSLTESGEGGEVLAGPEIDISCFGGEELLPDQLILALSDALLGMSQHMPKP